jgi:hypothetical protein
VSESRADQLFAALSPRERETPAAEALRRYLSQVERARDELRAILEPLLDEPIRDHDCLFCETRDVARDNPWLPPPGVEHAPTCPVRRREALLGRDGADGEDPADRSGAAP